MNDENPIPGVDCPNYGAQAVAAQQAGEPLPVPPSVPSANDVQHGGDHYRKRDYQHWDFVCDTEMPYLLGCATKYVARHADKGGAEDLDKATHYLQKADEKGVRQPPTPPAYVGRFCYELDWREAAIVRDIVNNDFAAARSAIHQLIRTVYPS